MKFSDQLWNLISPIERLCLARILHAKYNAWPWLNDCKYNSEEYRIKRRKLKKIVKKAKKRFKDRSELVALIKFAGLYMPNQRLRNIDKQIHNAYILKIGGVE